MRASYLGWSISLALGVAGLVAACSGGDEPIGGGGVIATGDAGGAPTDVPDTIEPHPELCQGLTLGGEATEELELMGDAPPPLGGKIEPGLYDLTELYTYTPASPPQDPGDDEPVTVHLSGRTGQATVIVTTYRMQIIEAYGTVGAALGAPTSRALAYRTDGTSLVGTNVCPSTAPPAPFSFSTTSPNSFALYVDASHRAIFTRRP